MKTNELSEQLHRVYQTVATAYDIQPGFRQVLAKCTELALKNLTLKVYREGYLDELIRLTRTENNLRHTNPLMERLEYEFVCYFCQRTIYPVLKAEKLATRLMGDVLDVLSVHMKGQGVDSVLLYLGLDMHANPVARLREEMQLRNRREYMERFLDDMAA